MDPLNLSLTSEDPLYSSLNLLNPYVPETWRSTGEPSAVNMDFDAPVSFDFLAAINCNATGFASGGSPILVTAGTAPNPDGTEFRAALTSGKSLETSGKDAWKHLPKSTKFQYVKFEFPVSGDGYTEAGMVLVGLTVKAPIVFQEDWQGGVRINNRTAFSDGQYFHSEMLSRQYEFSARFDGLDDDELATFYSQLYTGARGTDYPTFVIPRPAFPNEGFMMRLVETNIPQRRTGLNSFQCHFLEEVGGVTAP
jgi:hypothetical protein